MNILNKTFGIKAATFCAAACGLVLSTSMGALAAHPAAAPARAPAQTVIANVATAHGGNVSFNLLQDGSVSINASMSRADPEQSVLSRGHFATPVDLFRAVAPNRQVPAELLAANERYALRKAADGAANRTPTIRTQHAPYRNRISAQINQWFVDDFCNTGSTYTACYAGPAYGWAEAWASPVNYGHAVAYAVDQSLVFTVNTNGTWTVWPGYWQSAWNYQSCWPFSCGFEFDAFVNNASYFDFEYDVDY